MGQFSPMKIALALVAFMFLGADAFVTPSAFTGMGVSSGSRAGATARAAGAMRSRPTMNVVDVSEKWSYGRASVVQCATLPGCVCIVYMYMLRRKLVPPGGPFGVWAIQPGGLPPTYCCLYRIDCVLGELYDSYVCYL